MEPIRSSEPTFVQDLGKMLTDVNSHQGYLRIGQEGGEVTVRYEPKAKTFGAKIIQYIRRLFTPSFNLNWGMAILMTKLGEQKEDQNQKFAAKATLEGLKELGQYVNTRRIFRKINIGAVDQRIKEVIKQIHLPAVEVADFIKKAFPLKAGLFGAWKGTELSSSTKKEVEIASALAKQQFGLWLGSLSLAELKEFRPKFADFAKGSFFADIVDEAIRKKEATLSKST